MTSAPPINVLIVDDSHSDARLTQLWLRKSKLIGDVFHVSSGAEALQFLRRESTASSAPRVRLLVIDVQLPDMLGWDLIRMIQLDLSQERIPVIVLTGTVCTADARLVSELGIARYLAKPFDADEFQVLITEVEQVIRDA